MRRFLIVVVVVIVVGIVAYSLLYLYAPGLIEKPVLDKNLPNYQYLVFKPTKIIEYVTSGQNAGYTILKAELLNPQGQPIGEYTLEFGGNANDPNKLIYGMRNLAQKFGYNVTTLFVTANNGIYTYQNRPDILIINNNANYDYVIIPSQDTQQVTYGFETGNFKVIYSNTQNSLMYNETMQEWGRITPIADGMGYGVGGPLIIEVTINNQTYYVPAFYGLATGVAPSNNPYS